MNTISFRKAAGLSIRDLAELMEVSRSALGHYERGLRHLPTAGSVKYARLELAWRAFCRKEAEPAIILNEVRQAQWHQTLEMLQKEQADADFQIETLNRLLQSMQERYTKLEIKLLFIQVLKNGEYDQEAFARTERAPGKGEEAARRRRRTLFLQLKEDEVLKNMKFCGPEKQEKLIFRLELSKAKKNLAEKSIKRLAQKNAEKEV